MDEEKRIEVPIEKVLPQRVGALFMLEDAFFRSPFLRDKLPPSFFSNGNRDFDRMFSDTDSFHREFFDGDFFNNGRRYSTASNASTASQPNPGIIRHVPIKIQGSQNSLHTRNVSEPPTPLSSMAHEHVAIPMRKEVPIRLRDPDSISIHSAQFPIIEKSVPIMRRTQSSGRVSPDEMPYISATLPPQPPQRRYFATLLNKNRPGPTPNFTPSSISESRVPNPYYPSSINDVNDGSFSSSTTSTLGRGSPTISYRSVPITRHPSESISVSSKPESERPSTPKARPKSPSLARLQQGLKKAHILPSCVRGNETSDESDDQTRRVKVNGRISNENAPIPVPILLHQNQPLQPLANGSFSYVDPVEEAIRSLESFDPNKIIESATSSNEAPQTPPKWPSEQRHRGSGSDTDSGSTNIVRNTETTVAADSPTSSGIVADIMEEGDYLRSNTISSNNTSAYDLPSAENSATKPPQPQQAQPLPQPPPISRTASPQKATISFPNRPGYLLPMMSANLVNLNERDSRSSPTQSGYQYRTPQTTYGSLQRSNNSKTINREPEYLPKISEHDVSDGLTMQKRLLCTQMTDCAKVIEINAIKMSQYTAPTGWRQPHILQRNLTGIQDTIYTIEAALDELIECVLKVPIDRGGPKFEEFRQLANPLKTSQIMIHRLRATLDATNWTLSSLARMHTTPGGNDALDQFVAVLYQLPKDCRKLVQWVYLLGINGAAQSSTPFLPSSSTPTPTLELNRQLMSPYANVHPSEYRQPPPSTHHFPNTNLRDPKNKLTPTFEQTNRLHQKRIEAQKPVINKESPYTTSSPTPYIEKYESPKVLQDWVPSSAQYAPPPPSLLPLMPEEITMDGGESTSSAGSTIEMPSPQLPTVSKVESSGNSTPTATITQNHSQNQVPSTPTPMTATLMRRNSLDNNKEVFDEDEVVLQEDDLLSVASESVGSLYDEYAYVQGDPRNAPSSSSRVWPPTRNISKINANIFKGLTEEEKELLKFYEPQLGSHTANLCKLIEEFFNVVEEHQPPAKFVQKIRLIILEAQTLVYIGDNMAQCVANPALRAEFRQAADALNNLLNQCVSNARRAKDEYPSIIAVQTMVNCVVSVSQSAQNLKVLGQSCA